MDVLRWVSKNGLGIVVKSGLMTGLGETREEIMETLKDLKNAGCQIVTIGQYLQPRKENIGVQRYLSDEEFKELKEKGEDLGIKKVFSGPFVRSSYMAETQILNSKH
jgi:lipoic acid synthetase